MNGFRKRVFTPRNFLPVAAAAAASFPRLARSVRRPGETGALREQVMLAVTSVNDCRYCAWAHTGLALANDVDLDELRALLGEDLPDHLDERNATAVLFARHFADSERDPEASSRKALQRHFSEDERREIMAWINGIYFANLAGNTVDALLSRLRGQPAENSHLLVELLATSLAWPPLTAIWLASRKPNRPALGKL